MGARPAEVEYLSSYLREEPGAMPMCPACSSRAVQGQFKGSSIQRSHCSHYVCQLAEFGRSFAEAQLLHLLICYMFDLIS